MHNVESAPPRALRGAIALISACALAYEVLLARLFSLIQWHHFAFMVISLALLGYGVSGTVLALYRAQWLRHFTGVVRGNLLLGAGAMPICFALAQTIPFNPAEMLWAVTPWWQWALIYLLLALPFFFAANVIGLTFYRYGTHISAIYAADLTGAGVGSVAIIALLYLWVPEKILGVLALLAYVAAWCARYAEAPRANASLTGFDRASLVIGGAVLLWSSTLTLQPSPYKGEVQALRVAGARVVERLSSPLGVISVVANPQLPLRHAPGLSLHATADIPEQLAVWQDGDALSAITAFSGDLATLAYLDDTPNALPYHLAERFGNALVLGAGTGSEVLLALSHRVPRIDAVELDPQIVSLVRERYADFAGGIYSHPAVNIVIDDARGFVARSQQRYALISMALIDGSSVAGVHGLSENYLYTVEAVRAYWQRLEPEGYLAMTRAIKIPPRDEVKWLATVIEALRQLPATQPAQQLVMIRGWQTSTLLVKRGLITPQEIARLRDFATTRGFDLVYYPGIRVEETNRYHQQPQPYLHEALRALLNHDAARFFDHYKFAVTPATDDRPYLFHTLKWRTLPEILPLLRSGGAFLLESGYLLLLAALGQAIVASLVLIALPLMVFKQRLGITPQILRAAPRVLGYFFCLGLAFLFIEIAFMQKFILLLHHPVYAMTAVLSAFLLGAGLGSHYAPRWQQTRHQPIAQAVAGIVTLSGVAMALLDGLGPILQGSSALLRYLFAVLAILPLGFFMGMPFPLGLARLHRSAPALIAWAWGINGCASVISAMLAMLIALELGFSALLLAALALYGLAVLAFPHPAESNP